MSEWTILFHSDSLPRRCNGFQRESGNRTASADCRPATQCETFVCLAVVGKNPKNKRQWRRLALLWKNHAADKSKRFERHAVLVVVAAVLKNCERQPKIRSLIKLWIAAKIIVGAHPSSCSPFIEPSCSTPIAIRSSHSHYPTLWDLNTNEGLTWVGPLKTQRVVYRPHFGALRLLSRAIIVLQLKVVDSSQLYWSYQLQPLTST